jgi:hypothetical protein
VAYDGTQKAIIENAEERITSIRIPASSKRMEVDIDHQGKYLCQGVLRVLRRPVPFTCPA